LFQNTKIKDSEIFDKLNHEKYFVIFIEFKKLMKDKKNLKKGFLKNLNK
jgi:hypothetical protein